MTSQGRSPAATPRTVLLTGATGAVGTALLSALADFEIVALVHRQPLLGIGTHAIRGDVTQPRLGLEHGEFRALARRIDAIVHSAAVTSFTTDRDSAQNVNVKGTEHLLELASLAGAPLYYLSTAFVARADQVSGSDHGVSPYVASKSRAEERVRASGLPAVIIRPSVVIGDSVTGHAAAFQGLHGLAGALLRGFLPLVPLDPGARIDYVPRDVVARSVADIVRSGQVEGEHWLTAGADALPVRRVIELCMDVGRELGLDPVAPRLVAPQLVERLIRPVLIDTFGETAQRHFDGMLDMVTLFRDTEAFPSTLASLGRALSREQLERAFVASMRYWARQKGLADQQGLAA